jgi:molybdopterin/thiamine biosynthesis adenylyltransferase
MLRVAVVGAGGLGGPIALGLSTSCELSIFDGDIVELSNLHRQIQFCDRDLGHNKALALTNWLAGNPGHAHPCPWTPQRGDQLCQDCDLIIDASDSAATKFAVADWAIETGRPYIIASALGVTGSVVWGAPGHPCYRCWFESPPTQQDTCADAGVLGPILGVVASVVCESAVALARGDRTLAGSMWMCNDISIRQLQTRQLHLAARPNCPTCARSALPPTHRAIVIA